VSGKVTKVVGLPAVTAVWAESGLAIIGLTELI